MKFKLKFFVSHLIISLLVAILMASFVFWVWYPSPLASAVGVGTIFIMMLGIDVILGPLLTLLVAKKGKKTLKMDLLVIAIIQIGALLYGVYNISITRPVYIVYDNTRFDLVQANHLDSKISYYGKPRLVAIKPPANDDENMKRVNDELETGMSPSLNTDLYQDIELSRAQITANKKPLSELTQYNDAQIVQSALEKYEQVAGFFPLRTTNLDVTVLVDDKGGVVKIVDLRPWQ